MVSRRTRVAFWIFRRDHPSRPNAMICCFFSSFKTFAIVREATYPPAAVNVLDVSSESMAAFQVFMYGRFWVFTEVHVSGRSHRVLRQLYRALSLTCALRSRSVQRRKGRRWICRTYKREELPSRERSDRDRPLSVA